MEGKGGGMRRPKSESHLVTYPLLRGITVHTHFLSEGKGKEITPEPERSTAQHKTAKHNTALPEEGISFRATSLGRQAGLGLHNPRVSGFGREVAGFFLNEQ